MTTTPAGAATTTPEWAIRFGDGVIDTGWPTREQAACYIADIRAEITAGKVDADDYEPMVVMRRNVTTWTEAWAEE